MKELKMTPYANISGDSGVVEYEFGHDFIKVRFESSKKVYVYDHFRPGPIHVNKMKQLATIGQGLSTYISQNCSDKYSKKE